MVSDHIPILITINSSRNPHSPIPIHSAESSSTNTLSFNLNKANWPSFAHYVQNSTSSLLDTTSSNISYSTFIDIINHASSISISVKNHIQISILLPFLGGILPVLRLVKTDLLFSNYFAAQVLWLTLLPTTNLVLQQHGF